ncbi:hypothetical protein AGABI2DRAFT_77738 [Agaricus bisporus var. bisporus H97]|uniref:hypothetical protein n=1 Tax=Agaricus bisporus var. bisporus (strain H97 / ATCC MYA-4626 / FGSC 10389) TaxID=936046 RepID=UPI00029F794A|nr:hypothetical protein AGABI2DRAFT_77738 [Agaricus bisporus var. bisporus H97]EKV42721.1 hypothetical protein AGABI2DRAFT_77738 [Agaricus bisporus var. bisporus H97]
MTGTNKNAHLKGRKRFMADFHDLKEECGDGFTSCGLRVMKIRSEDEGSLEVVIENEAEEHVVSVNLLVSDTTDYPKSHSFLCYASSDEEIPARVQAVIEEFASEKSHIIRDTVLLLLARVSKALGLHSNHIESDNGEETEEAEDDEDEDFLMFSDDDEIYNAGPFSTASANKCDMTLLQRDFLEIVAAEYRPGFIKHHFDQFLITVSIPILRLTDIIPPRALMAWDRALLSKTQHLCVLISGFNGIYPVLNQNGSYSAYAFEAGANIQFKIGLTQRYKLGKEEARTAIRKHGLLLDEVEEEPQEEVDSADELEACETPMVVQEDEKTDPNRFDHFSLSNSLESLMNQSFLKLLQFRLTFGLNWGGAEKLLDEVERSQNTPQETFVKFQDDIIRAEAAEKEFISRIALSDPIQGSENDSHLNLPLIVICYLVRRLAICPQYCIVCHRKLESSYEALKPYVCDSKLCSYQYYALNRGAPLEYEIVNNPHTVDLLVSLAYTAAIEGVLEEPPIGMGLRVLPPTTKITVNSKHRPQHATLNEVLDGKNVTAEDGLCEFDELTLPEMRSAIVASLENLPTVSEMRNHLTKKVAEGKVKPRLQDIDLSLLPSTWLILRWCVASCTAYLEEITNQNELVRGLDSNWRQFRFSVGAPSAEAEFQRAVEEAKQLNVRAKDFPILYAFHGSPLRNWHSIIRHGLWFKEIAHGRAYGNGVYLAKDGSISSLSYATPGRVWSKSAIAASHCIALAEVVNLPDKFVCQMPSFVIDQTHWILCRYLLVRGRELENPGEKEEKIPFVKMDSNHPTTFTSKAIKIPEPSYTIQKLLESRRLEFLEDDFDDEDRLVFEHVPETTVQSQRQQQSQAQPVTDTFVTSASKKKTRPVNDWKHDPDYVKMAVENLLPPPEDSSIAASMALQRELQSMIKEQDSTPSFKELGWYMPLEFNEENLFQWIVEMHSFDPDIPIAQDMIKRKINSIIFEIRFPSTFPLAPPFFRILRPRFLPFIQGGGGHVTGGGSICLDLLTADGWSPAYNIPAVLMQIKLAISNLDPRPARLDASWNTPYQMREALEGYMRAANTHGWRVSTFMIILV